MSLSINVSFINRIWWKRSFTVKELPTQLSFNSTDTCGKSMIGELAVREGTIFAKEDHTHISFKNANL